jgi:hypothetical protein
MSDSKVSSSSADDMSGKKRVVSRQVGQECVSLLELKSLDFEYPGRHFLSRMRRQIEKKRYLAITESEGSGLADKKTRAPLNLHKLSGTSLHLTRSWNAKELQAVEERPGESGLTKSFRLHFNDGSSLLCVPIRMAELEHFLQTLQACYRHVFGVPLPVRSAPGRAKPGRKPARLNTSLQEPMSVDTAASNNTMIIAGEDTRAAPYPETVLEDPQMIAASKAPSNSIQEMSRQDTQCDVTQAENLSESDHENHSSASVMRPDIAGAHSVHSTNFLALDLGFTAFPTPEAPWQVLELDWSQWALLDSGAERLRSLSATVKEQALELTREQSRWQRLLVELRHQPWMQTEDWRQLLALQQEIKNLRALEQELRHALDLCTLSDAELDALKDHSSASVLTDEALWALAEKLVKWQQFATEHPSWRPVMESAPLRQSAQGRVAALMGQRLVRQVEHALQSSATTTTTTQTPGDGRRSQANVWLEGCRLLSMLAVDAKKLLFDECLDALVQSRSFQDVITKLQTWMTKTTTMASEGHLKHKHVEQFARLLSEMHRVSQDCATRRVPMLTEAAPFVIEGALHQAFGTPLFTWLESVPANSMLAWLVILLAFESAQQPESVETLRPSTTETSPSSPSHGAGVSLLTSDPEAKATASSGHCKGTLPEKQIAADAVFVVTWESWLRQCVERARTEWRRILRQEAQQSMPVPGSSSVNSNSFMESVTELAGGMHTPFGRRCRQEWDYYRQSPAFASQLHQEIVEEPIRPRATLEERSLP